MPGPLIVDVFPRDGLQVLVHERGLREPSTEEKVQLIAEIDRTGVAEIEVTGFVHPRVIPPLADAEQVVQAAGHLSPRAVLRALVPNLRGAERAISAGVRKVSCLIVASETYQRLNSRMSVDQNLDEIERVVELCRRHQVQVAVGIGTSFICPYEGVIDQAALERICERVLALGVPEITLADSVGLAWPALVRERCARILERWPDLRLGLHLHTLAGLALANALTGWEAGATIFEGSVGGIGGGIAMPIHTTNMGNVATEDLVYLFESTGIPTGVDLESLAAAGRRAQELIGTGSGHVTSFGSLEAFLRQSRQMLPSLLEAVPGASRKTTGGTAR